MNLVECGKLESFEDTTKRLLAEKYKQDFEVERIQSNNVFDGYFCAIAYPIDAPDILFHVSVNSDGEGESDNYVSKLLELELADLVAQNLDELQGIYYIYCSFLIESLALTDPEISLYDYCEEHPQNRVNIYLHYCPDNINDIKFVEHLKDTFNNLPNISGNLYFYLVDEDKLKEIQDYIENTDQLYDDYTIITEENFKGTIKFLNNKFVMSEEEIKYMMESR